MTTAPSSVPTAGVRPQRRRVLGYLLYAIACVVLLLTVAATFVLFGDGFGFGTVGDSITVVVLLLLCIGLLVFAEGFLVPDVRAVRADDTRAPVLFLRPFGEDTELTYDVISSGETATTITAKAEDFLLALNALGPLVSIAEPNRAARLGWHPQGVARDYIGDGDWQARVIALLDDAQLVVLAIGDSPGIEWEVAQVRARVAPQDLLLYLPPRPVGALTRKGRDAKQRMLYEQFAPVVERQFDVVMPAYSDALYLIGFDAAGQPLMAPDAPLRGWQWTEHARTAAAIRAQLDAVMARVRPGVDLRPYRLPGRTGLWARLAATLTLMVLAVAIGFGGRNGSAVALVSALVPLVPGIAVVTGWVLLARYFRRTWVWLIPLLLLVLYALDAIARLGPAFGWVDGYTLLASGWYQGISWLINAAYSVAVLALGLLLLGQRARQ